MTTEKGFKLSWVLSVEKNGNTSGHSVYLTRQEQPCQPASTHKAVANLFLETSQAHTHTRTHARTQLHTLPTVHSVCGPTPLAAGRSPALAEQPLPAPQTDKGHSHASPARLGKGKRGGAVDGRGGAVDGRGGAEDGRGGAVDVRSEHYY